MNKAMPDMFYIEYCHTDASLCHRYRFFLMFYGKSIEGCIFIENDV